MAAATTLRRLPLLGKILVGLGVLVLALVLLVAFFPWDLLRGPINRYVTEKTGRHFEITRHLDVKVGRTTRVFMDGIVFANPDWAQDPHLVKADAAEVHVRLWPLLKRQIELPMVRLTRPQLGLQAEPDGRRTWSLGGDTKDESNVPTVGALVVDEGSVHYVASAQGADVRLDFAMDNTKPADGAATPAMPLRFEARGQWQKQPFQARGRTGDVLYLSAPLQKPFPAEVDITAGKTTLQARGQVASLATLDGASVDFRIAGENLAQLYDVVGVVLPDTPRYKAAGQLSKQGERWQVRNLDGTLGRTDIAGDMAYEKTGKVPVLNGQLRSRLLDFEDLAPVIGLKDDGKDRKPAARTAAKGTPKAGESREAAAAAPEKPRASPVDVAEANVAKRKEQAQAQSQAEVQGQAPTPQAKDGKQATQTAADANRKVLPDAPLDVTRLRSMNADVRIDAAKVVNAKGLPIERMRTHVRLQDGVLQLDPLDLGIAGGQLAGRLRIDATGDVAAVQVRLDGRALELSRLVPTSESMRRSLGKLQAQVDLTSRGGSVRQVLANANGDVAMLMGRGEISNLLLEIAGLDGGELVKFFVGGDRRVQLRCAVTSFQVASGVMTSRAFLLDTDDTVFHGNARIDLGREAMEILIRPEPKDTSILSLRSPLKVGGTFGDPDIGIQAGSLAGRAVAALALGAINPLLALAATIETGPGQDADCAGTLRQAAAPRAQERVERTAPPPAPRAPEASGPPDDRRRLGAAQSSSSAR